MGKQTDKQYYAHSKEVKSDVGEEGETEGETEAKAEAKPEAKAFQTVAEHSQGVAERMKEFAADWCDETLAEDIGLLHDVGKYQPSFQRRILGGGNQVEHSHCGAKEWANYKLPDGAAYIIAGHHAGLPDAGNRTQKEAPTLLSRLQRNSEDYSAYREELPVRTLPSGDCFKGSVQGKGEEGWKEYAFWIRMTYSCLTDADFLDTEQFCNGETERGVQVDFEECVTLLDEKLQMLEKGATTETELARKKLRLQMMAHSGDRANVYYMNMPTGSGKTLASMRFALERAIGGKKKRIIYVIPYTSIIEQNAKVFKGIFGEDKVLAHHCNFEYADSGEGATTAEKMKRATENWDASIIVTTNVQFFQSIYGNRAGEMRKLHNMANSVLLFDEAHLLPAGCFQPCLEAIKMLTARYGCEAILMSATMPNFDVWLSEFKCSGLSTQNLIDDDSCFAAFDRCRIENLGKIDDETLLRRADEGRNALIVVNTRKKAKQLYELYAGQKYHLSTYMTHADRERTIEKVKAALAGGEHFCLFSTSLIEAGVDLDFDVVFREMAGLESLLQTAGRCNRSGLKDRNFCVAYSFESEEKTPPDLAKKVYYTQEAFKNFERIDSQKAIGEYFDRLYKDEKANMSRLDFVNAAGADGSSPSERYRFFSPERVRSADLRSITPFNFAGYAQTFRMIDENTRPLVIVNGGNRAEVKALFAALKNGASGKSVGRKLQKYVVALRSYEWAALEKLGVIETCEGFDRLANENYYNENTGLSLEDANDYIV